MTEVIQTLFQKCSGNSIEVQASLYAVPVNFRGMIGPLKIVFCSRNEVSSIQTNGNAISTQNGNSTKARERLADPRLLSIGDAHRSALLVSQSWAMTASVQSTIVTTLNALA